MYIREVRQCGKNRVADIRHFFKAAKIPPVFRKNRKKILPHRWEVVARRKICHCEPVRRLAWQSVSKAPDFRLF